MKLKTTLIRFNNISTAPTDNKGTNSIQKLKTRLLRIKQITLYIYIDLTVDIAQPLMKVSPIEYFICELSLKTVNVDFIFFRTKYVNVNNFSQHSLNIFKFIWKVLYNLILQNYFVIFNFR